MSFKNIVGQEKIIGYLIQSIKENRIGHAYILDGPEGAGKETMALAFAKGVLCQNFYKDACCTCASCIKIDSRNHPDVKIIEPEGLHILNHQIDELQQDLFLKPYESNKKVFIIKDADTMTDRAQNRLLKTLEEPPAYALILLLSTNFYSFLPTIRSRCQILKLNRVAFSIIENYLKQRYEVSLGEARVLAAFSDGILGKAVRLKKSEEFKSEREGVIAIIEKLLERDNLQSFSLIKFFEDHKENIEGILDLMLLWFRDLLLLCETKSEELLINFDKKELLKSHVKFIKKQKIPYIIENIEKTKRNIKANVNFELSIEMMILQIQEVCYGNSCWSKV